MIVLTVDFGRTLKHIIASARRKRKIFIATNSLSIAMSLRTFLNSALHFDNTYIEVNNVVTPFCDILIYITSRDKVNAPINYDVFTGIWDYSDFMIDHFNKLYDACPLERYVNCIFWKTVINSESRYFSGKVRELYLDLFVNGIMRERDLLNEYIYLRANERDKVAAKNKFALTFRSLLKNTYDKYNEVPFVISNVIKN